MGYAIGNSEAEGICDCAGSTGGQAGNALCPIGDHNACCAAGKCGSHICGSTGANIVEGGRELSGFVVFRTAVVQIRIGHTRYSHIRAAIGSYGDILDAGNLVLGSDHELSCSRGCERCESQSEASVCRHNPGSIECSAHAERHSGIRRGSHGDGACPEQDICGESSGIDGGNSKIGH